MRIRIVKVEGNLCTWGNTFKLLNYPPLLLKNSTHFPRNSLVKLYLLWLKIGNWGFWSPWQVFQLTLQGSRLLIKIQISLLVFVGIYEIATKKQSAPLWFVDYFGIRMMADLSCFHSFRSAEQKETWLSFLQRYFYYMVFKDTGKSLHQWFPSCGAYAIMIDKLFKMCAFMQQFLCKEGIASLCSAENWSNSYHTLFLPNTAAGASATMAWVEPGALSMVVAFKQAQLRNLCSDLSAVLKAGCILFWKNMPKAGG